MWPAGIVTWLFSCLTKSRGCREYVWMLFCATLSGRFPMRSAVPSWVSSHFSWGGRNFASDLPRRPQKVPYMKTFLPETMVWTQGRTEKFTESSVSVDTGFVIVLYVIWQGYWIVIQLNFNVLQFVFVNSGQWALCCITCIVTARVPLGCIVPGFTIIILYYLFFVLQ